MAAALSLMILTMIALVLGGIFLLRRGSARKQAILMFVLAAVMAVNVAIWTLPDSSGQSLAAAAQE